MLRSLVCFALVCGSILSMAAVGIADMPGPGRRTHRLLRPDPLAEPPRFGVSTVPFAVCVDDTGSEESRLLVPQKLLQQRMQGRDQTSDWQPRARTALAGLAMSLAVGGAFFVRGTKAGRLTLMMVIVTGALLASMSVAFADMSVPWRRHAPEPPSPVSAAEDIATSLVPANLKVKIQIVPGLDRVMLALSKKDAARAGLISEPSPAPAPPAPTR